MFDCNAWFSRSSGFESRCSDFQSLLRLVCDIPQYDQGLNTSYNHFISRRFYSHSYILRCTTDAVDEVLFNKPSISQLVMFSLVFCMQDLEILLILWKFFSSTVLRIYFIIFKFCNISEVFLELKIAVLRVVTPCNLMPVYTALQPRRQPSSYSPPWEPQVVRS
jgi:hypothetical protein